MPQQAASIDEVIRRLTEIVEESATRPLRLGYFAALYRKVTITIKQRIDAGDFFEDNARMERLDVIFANRYLQAYDQIQAGAPTRCWGFAFQETRQWWPIALQHLLLGMNAHINLDLGIAAVQTVGAGDLAPLQGDFIRINDLLAGLVGDVKAELAGVWPPLRWLNHGLGSVETSIINFSMTKARDAAWCFAEELAPLNESDRHKAIERRDAETAALALLIRYPGVYMGLVAKVVRLGERGSVAGLVRVLE